MILIITVAYIIAKTTLISLHQPPALLKAIATYLQVKASYLSLRDKKPQVAIIASYVNN